MDAMRTPRSASLPILAAVAACAALAGCGGGGSGDSTATASTVTQVAGADAVPSHPAPPLSLTDYRGHRVDLQNLHGRPVLVAFLYTHCTDLCPIVAGKVHTAFAHLPRAERPLFLAVSVDPAHDTPASARAFNRAHRTTGEIDWLLGSHKELAAVWKAWGVKPERNADDPEEIEHNAEIVAIDPQGRIVALYPSTFKPSGLAAGSVQLAGL
jgi:protein SCO1/2